MMPKDLRDLLRAFNHHRVKFLVVGGYAFGVHAEPRATKDLDISSAQTKRTVPPYFAPSPNTVHLSMA
jgi:uncharacterized protein YjlB